MKVLWITNTIFPELSKFLNINTPVVGGWMYGLANDLKVSENVNLAVATVYSSSEFKKVSINSIDYYLLPCKNNINYDQSLEDLWERVCIDFNPDIIHIHGTEYTHGLACISKLTKFKYVISIQGLIGIYSRYYSLGMSLIEIFLNISLRDIIKNDNIFQAKRKLEKRAILESKYISITSNIIGRTQWDFVHCTNINKNVSYHFCNESLREVFYSARKWEYKNCEPETIFVSQINYPIKGFHQLLKAVFLVKKEYPNIKIKVGGVNVCKNEKIIDRIKITGYGKYLNNLIRKYNLINNVLFLDLLNEDQMVEEFLKANIFICPSTIENSPNSLGEAQLLGVPVIASYVGGVPDMVENNITGLLYRFEEVEMLANCIRKLFIDSIFATKLSQNSIIEASIRHNKNTNLTNTISIYQKIIDS